MRRHLLAARSDAAAVGAAAAIAVGALLGSGAAGSPSSRPATPPALSPVGTATGGTAVTGAGAPIPVTTTATAEPGGRAPARSSPFGSSTTITADGVVSSSVTTGAPPVQTAVTEAVPTTDAPSPTAPPPTIGAVATIPPTTVAATASTTSAAALGMGSATAYSFEGHEPDGTPLRWDRCQPLYWKLSTDHLVAGSAAEIERAVGMLAAATGQPLVYEGTTAEPADLNWTRDQPLDPGHQPPVVIGWMPAGQGAMSLVHGDLLGANDLIYTAQPARRAGWDVIVTDVISLNATAGDRLPAGFAPGEEGVVILHELGHLYGLGHTPDPAQIMHDGPDGQPGRYGAGDLAGLGALAGSSCLTPGPWGG